MTIATKANGDVFARTAESCGLRLPWLLGSQPRVAETERISHGLHRKRDIIRRASCYRPEQLLLECPDHPTHTSTGYLMTNLVTGITSSYS